MSERNQRGKNFSVEEELLLVDLEESKKHILENTNSDAVNLRLKNETWMELEQSFKSQSGVHRPWKALKDKYDNVKRKAKMELATEKMERNRTGGGTTSNGLVSAVSERVLSLVGDTAAGFYNPSTNDANNNNIQEDTIEVEFIDVMDYYNSNCILEGDFLDLVEETSELSKAKIKTTIEPCLTGAKRKVSKELFIANKNKKTSMEEEKKELLKSQQPFMTVKKTRASEKHLLEIESLKLKNQILALELKEKQAKCNTFGKLP